MLSADHIESSNPVEFRPWPYELHGRLKCESHLMGRTAHHYLIFETAGGFCGIAWNSVGITRFRLPTRSAKATERILLRRVPGAEPGALTPEVAKAVAAVKRYFEGEETDFSGFGLDLGEQDPFFERIYAAARRVAWGHTTTYGALANELGAGPEAARDVGQAMARNPLNGFCPNSRDFVVFLRDVLIGVVSQQRCRHNADDGTAEDVKRNRQTRSEGGEQRCRDERRRPAGDDRGQLIAERTAAVAKARREAFCDQRRFGAVQGHDRQPRHGDSEEYQSRHLGVEQREINEPENRHEHAADDIHPLTADAVGQMPGDRNPEKPQDGLDALKTQFLDQAILQGLVGALDAAFACGVLAQRM